MPTITINLIEGRTQDQKRQLVSGITDVVLNTLKVSPERVVVYINEIKEEHAGRGGVLRCDEKKR